MSSSSCSAGSLYRIVHTLKQNIFINRTMFELLWGSPTLPNSAYVVKFVLLHAQKNISFKTSLGFLFRKVLNALLGLFHNNCQVC